MKSLVELALDSIKRDVTLFTEHLHELPFPLLEQLLTSLSPYQLLLLEQRLGPGLNTEKAWKNLCEVNRYLNRHSGCSPIADQDILTWRNFFIKMYMSSYLVPYITKKYSCEPTLQIYKTPPDNECVSYQAKRDEFAGLSFEAFHDHLLQISAYTCNLSVRWRNFALFQYYPGLIEALQPSLRVLSVNCWKLKDYKCKTFLRNLAHIMSAGKLTSLHLDNAERLPWDMFFQLISGCLHCQMCLSALPEIFKFSVDSAASLEQHPASMDPLEIPAFDEKWNESSDRSDDSGMEQTLAWNRAEQDLDLFDEALLCGGDGEKGHRNDSYHLWMPHQAEASTEHGCEKTRFSVKLIESPGRDGILRGACRHEAGIQRFKMSFSQPVKSAPFVAMAHWLPSWMSLKHLTLSLKNDAGLESAKDVILDKVRTRQLKTLNLSAGPLCYHMSQLFWDVLQVLGDNVDRLDLCPMQCFGFSSDAPLCFQELPCADVFLGVHHLLLEGTDFSQCHSLVGSLAKFIVRDHALTHIHLNDCIFSQAETEQLLEAIAKKDPQIIELSLNGTDLSARLIQEYVHQVIIKNQNLSLLSLSNCRLGPEHIMNPTFLDAVRSHQSLNKLNISRNLLGECVERFVEKVVYPESSIKHLDLRKTNCSTFILDGLADFLLQHYPATTFPLLESISLDTDHSSYGTPNPTVLKWKGVAENVNCAIWEHTLFDYIAQM
ncbi:uncharacterized protein LOC112574379 [Pomacea canaliculata]|nr:uncharacterized protein LOC112574379 [Pomacea canaliculata]XP_025111209.1 uncharacterized protein LOC112574379 [Pomacea canaliculata]